MSTGTVGVASHHDAVHVPFGGVLDEVLAGIPLPDVAFVRNAGGLESLAGPRGGALAGLAALAQIEDDAGPEAVRERQRCPVVDHVPGVDGGVVGRREFGRVVEHDPISSLPSVGTRIRAYIGRRFAVGWILAVVRFSGHEDRN